MVQQSYIKLLIFIILIAFSALGKSQYESNPLEGKQWGVFSLGGNTADFNSYQIHASYSKRSDFIITSGRLAYNQELFSATNDSVLSFKNKSFEIGMLWGEGYGGKNWYFAASIGMGLNIRRYGDDLEDTTAIRKLTGVTIGIPAQIELGAFFNDQWGTVLMANGNWNFRQPYIGLNVGVVYRPKKAKK